MCGRHDLLLRDGRPCLTGVNVVRGCQSTHYNFLFFRHQDRSEGRWKLHRCDDRQEEMNSNVLYVPQLLLVAEIQHLPDGGILRA